MHGKTFLWVYDSPSPLKDLQEVVTVVVVTIKISCRVLSVEKGYDSK
jgi:hypothetical protein